jgi:hypothetical protein
MAESGVGGTLAEQDRYYLFDLLRFEIGLSALKVILDTGERGPERVKIS